MLIQRGAPLNDQDEDGLTPLHRAVLNGRLNTVQLLIASQAFPHRASHRTRLV